MPRWGQAKLALYTAAVAVPLGVILAGSRFGIPAFVFEHVMVLVVVAAAVAGGLGPAITVAVVGTLGDNVLLRHPVGQPAITGVRDAIDLGLFLAVGLIVGWLVARLRSSTERAFAAAERERIAREERDRLIATMTHDLATPLTAIRGTVQFARNHPTGAELDYQRLLARVETAAARATALIRALADARSIHDDSLELTWRIVDLREVVTPIVTMLDRTSDRHPIAFAVSDEPLVARCDPERLGRVVENLLSNAIKYSPNGGTIEVALLADGDHAALSVRDYGIGIPREFRGRLFTSGFRAPGAIHVAPGLGLGLHIASEIVRHHGGRIDVIDPPGGGTQFTVHIPIERATAAVGSAPSTSLRDAVPVSTS